MSVKVNRKHVGKLLDNVKFIQLRYELIKEQLIQTVGEKKYSATMQHYDEVISIIKERIKNMPIGHSYKGKFFLKKTGYMPHVFEEYNGALFMREDLTSWQMQEGDRILNYKFYRDVYKDAEGKERLTKEDGKPVYAK